MYIERGDNGRRREAENARELLLCCGPPNEIAAEKSWIPADLALARIYRTKVHDETRIYMIYLFQQRVFLSFA